MDDTKDKKRIWKLAAELYKDVPLNCPPELELANFLDLCSENNLSIFLSAFVCHGLFGHSQPESLEGKDAVFFMKQADPFLQTVIAQKEGLA